VHPICLLAVLLIVLHDFVFFGRAELFSGGANLWRLAYQVSLALVGSYIFFYLNIHLPRLRDKRRLRPFWNSRAKIILDFAQGISRELVKAAGETLSTDFPATEQDTLRLSGKANPYAATDSQSIQGFLSGSPNTYLSVLERMYSLRLRTKQYVEDIHTTTPFLDAEFLRLVNDIENCTFFFTLDGQSAFPMGVSQTMFANTDMKGWASQMHDYFEAARRLKDYVDRNLS
jgi:hypothetical protein